MNWNGPELYTGIRIGTVDLILFQNKKEEPLGPGSCFLLFEIKDYCSHSVFQFNRITAAVLKSQQMVL